MKPVALAPCPDYTPANVCQALGDALRSLGGMERFVSAGQTVFIKPNLLTDRAPEQAVTTHPELVRQTIRMVRDCGGRPSVGDSPASAVKLERVWDRTGFRRMCDEEQTPLVSLEESGSVPMSVNGCRFSVARPLLDADVVINMPKVKTHALTMLTGAVKNLYGAIPGYQKTVLHGQFPSVREFARLLQAVRAVVPAHLHVADGVVGMEGEGPSAGTPVCLGFLAVGDDPVAVDLALCAVLGIRVRDVAYLDAMQKATPCAPYYTLASADEIGPPSFRLPSALPPKLIVGRLVRMLKPWLWIRPCIGSACIGCGRCIEACPVGALSWPSGTSIAQGLGNPRAAPTESPGGRTVARPVLADGLCIGCCCCTEVCPVRAVSMRQSPFLNLLRRGRLP